MIFIDPLYNSTFLWSNYKFKFNNAYYVCQQAHSYLMSVNYVLFIKMLTFFIQFKRSTTNLMKMEKWKFATDTIWTRYNQTPKWLVSNKSTLYLHDTALNSTNELHPPLLTLYICVLGNRIYVHLGIAQETVTHFTSMTLIYIIVLNFGQLI